MITDCVTLPNTLSFWRLSNAGFPMFGGVVGSCKLVTKGPDPDVFFAVERITGFFAADSFSRIFSLLVFVVPRLGLFSAGFRYDARFLFIYPYFIMFILFTQVQKYPSLLL